MDAPSNMYPPAPVGFEMIQEQPAPPAPLGKSYYLQYF